MKVAADLVQRLVDVVVGRAPEQARFDECDGRVVDREYYRACAEERTIHLMAGAGVLKVIP